VAESQPTSARCTTNMHYIAFLNKTLMYHVLSSFVLLFLFCTIYLHILVDIWQRMGVCGLGFGSSFGLVFGVVGGGGMFSFMGALMYMHFVFLCE
jgi:hypothetical protein